MSFTIDIIILAIIGLFTFIGYKQGLIKSAIKILAFAIAIIISIILYKPIANFIIENTEIDENIQNVIVEKILPEGMNDDVIVHEQIPISEIFMETANKTIKEIAIVFSTKIIEASTLMILFVLVKVILMFVSALSTLISKLPVIKQLDKSGGTIYGLIKGLVVVWFVLGIINLISPLIQLEFIEMIENSIIGSILYRYNLLLILLF